MRARTLLLTTLLFGAAAVAWSQQQMGPVLQYSIPLEGDLTNNRSQTITLKFTQDVDVKTSAVLVTGQAGALAVSAAHKPADPKTLIVTPTRPLADGTYTVDYSGVRGVTGYPVEGAVPFSFTVDGTPPSLVSSSPAAGQIGVPVDTQISLTFSEPLQTRDMPDPFNLTGPSGVVPLELVSSDEGTKTYVYRPLSPLAMSTAYTVDYSPARDAAGNNPAPPASFTFTTASPTPLTLVTSSPANGAAGVSTAEPIVLTFSNDLDPQASSVTVTGAGAPAAGTLFVAGPTATFTPTKDYAAGTVYTVQFSGIRDVYGQSPTAPAQMTFSTAGAVLNGRVDPQMVTLAAGQQVGVTYLIQNLSGSNVSLRSSAAEFYVNDQLVATVNVPAEANVPANGAAALASDVAISEQIQSAARQAGTDQIVMMRTFTSPAPGAGQATSVTIPLLIRVGSSLAGPASVTEIILDVPPDSKTVGQFDEIRAHAFIRGTGTGAVVGTWFVDGQPTETFQINLTAGLTQEVWTRLTLPTLDLGEHEVELRIGRPQPVTSGGRRYVVVPKGAGSQRVLIVSPVGETALQPGNVRTSFRWVPMPGSSGCEIAFARDLSALGLDERGDILDGPLGRIVWHAGMVASGQLSLLARVPSDVAAWTPSAEEYERLFAQPPGVGYWAVRAIYPAESCGDPTTTSRPGRLRVPPQAASLVLVSPEQGETIPAREALFKWGDGPEGSIYEFVILSDDHTVYTALTRATQFALSDLSAFKLQPGRTYSWQVSALQPTEGVAAVSSRRAFTVRSEPGASVVPVEPATGTAVTGQAVAITSSGVYLLPGAVSELTITPPNGAVVASQQPSISAAYPDAAPGAVVITLNGVDVTALASVTPTSATLQPPGVFSEGQHTVAVTVNTSSGAQLQDTSTFTVAVPQGMQPAAATSSATGVQQAQVSRPLQLDFNWNWRPTTQGEAGGDLIMDLSFRGQQTWVWRSDSYAAFNFQFAKPGDGKLDLANFLAEAVFKGGKYKASAGDIGMDQSELTAQGLTSRAFNFVSNAGPLRLTGMHTLGRTIQRSSIGRAPDVLLFTAETAGAAPQRGLKLTYVDSESDLAGTSSFVGPTRSEVISVAGRTPLGKSGLNIRTELARSSATVVSAFGSQDSKGSAFTTTVDGIVAGFGVATSYRRIGNEYVSTTSTTLTNDIKGWTLAVNRPLGHFVSTTVNYSTYENMPTSNTPASSLTSRSLDLTANFPKWPSLTLRAARNDSSSDPFTAGGRRGDTEENVWSATANYAGQKLNGYLTYSKSDFDDFFDFVDPNLDTPNDRRTGTWSFGLGAQLTKSLKLRADWGANATNRWLRSLLGVPPSSGSDRSHQARVQAEYLISPKISATMSWSNSKYTDALGSYASDFSSFNARLNYFLKLTRSGGGVALTTEYRRYKHGGSSLGGEHDEFNILINDNRMFTF